MPDALEGISYRWFSPYVKVYALGGMNRCAEISTYPRAYRDTAKHIYTEDTPFIVTQDDLNQEDSYLDSKQELQKIGETAYHFKGESLPGAFPRWLEADNLPFTSIAKNLHTFLCDGMPYPMRVCRIEVNKGNGWKELPANILKSAKDQVIQFRRDVGGTFVGKVSIPKKIQELPKVLVRIYYEKRE